MSEDRPPEGNVSAEFRKLGKNLTEVLRSAWDAPERKRLQQEVVTGLSELGITIREEVETFKESPTGQRIKSNAQTMGQKVRASSGEVENRVREDLLSALRTMNDQLQKAIEKMSREEAGAGTASGVQSSAEQAEPMMKEEGPVMPSGDVESSPYKDTGHREVHPDDVDSTPSQGVQHQEVHPDDVES